MHEQLPVLDWKINFWSPLLYILTTHSTTHNLLTYNKVYNKTYFVYTFTYTLLMNFQ